MAIIEELGIEVSVCVGNEPLPEYDDPDPPVGGEAPVCNKYVESRDNAEFMVRVTFLKGRQPGWVWEHRSPVLTSQLSIDGACIQGTIAEDPNIRDKDLVIDWLGSRSFDAQHNQHVLRKFKFSPVVVSMTAYQLRLSFRHVFC